MTTSDRRTRCQPGVDRREGGVASPGLPVRGLAGDDPHALDHLMEGLRFTIDDEVDENIGSVLALIGRVTRTDIATDWIEATHSRLGRPV
ncbi:hypothetical protein [Bailinhaonella thermotolerans]|uniref:hypothetical protein n=1 Tax=Bailinhaonella thermotolerans TaxID=1070861 RepID=UPI0011C41ED3|nr:hypothetical protein [Bailinhaonella thermotolerans]